MNKKEKRKLYFYTASGGILLFAAAFLFHFCELPGEMRFPAIVPDSTENALGAYNFYRYGEFKFALNHFWHPVRYPIFPQLFIFLPGIILSGGVLVWGVAGVWFTLILGVLALLLIGKKCGNLPAGMLTAGFLCCSGEFHTLANSAMTEIPYTAFLLLGALLFLSYTKAAKIYSGKRLIFFSLLCGFLLTVAGSMRATALPMLLLFLFPIFFAKSSWNIKLLSGAALFLPAFFLMGGILFYQYEVFGDPFRSGYHYWCPVPYDFPSLPFHISYIPGNWKRFFLSRDFFVLVSAISLFLLSRIFTTERAGKKRFRDAENALFLFALLQMGIILFLYLPYCGYTARYCIPALPLLLLSSILSAGTLLRHFVPYFSFRKGVFSGVEMLLAFLLLVAGMRILEKEKKIPVTFSEVQFLQFCDEVLPKDATLITSFNPALTELFFVEKSPERKQLPFTRNLEYTDKVIAPESIRNRIPPPAKDTDHLHAASAPGTRLAIADVLAETFPEKWTGSEKYHFSVLPLEKRPHFITNLTLYQIPEKMQVDFLRKFRFEKCHERPPMVIYRLHNRKEK